MGAGIFQPWHLILILVLALILFGAGKLADTGGALGKSIREFRQAVKEPDDDKTTATGGRACTQCGTKLTATDRFCPSCGTPVASRA